MNFFTYQEPVLAALRAIPDLIVRTTLDESDIDNLSAVMPTAVVRWSRDTTQQTRPDAVVAERAVTVHLLIMGATPDSEDEDGQLAQAVFDALHGLDMPGHGEPLTYQGGQSQLTGSIREYVFDFSTTTVVRKSAGAR